MRTILAGLLAVITYFGAGAGAGNAGPKAVVVELYTSAGCSSCPPADAMLGKLAERDGVIALGLHVDYWDYIGWKDQFGDPAYTERQKSYARFARHRSVYTPQLIVGGTGFVVGNKPMDVVDFINAQQAQASQVDLTISRKGGRVVINASALDAQPMIVQLVRYTPRSVVQVGRGENAGRTIEYFNIVNEWHQIQKWNGTEPLRTSARIKGSDPVVVIVQAVGPGPILAAARLR
ncbi:MAG: DUF1223 domain-containing protein [Marinosulfonomonas sp.]|nr:DUF1223 domain-containing protein [Marinosulfonomonas sp.]